MSSDAAKTIDSLARNAPPWLTEWLEGLDQFRREEFYGWISAYGDDRFDEGAQSHPYYPGIE